MSDMLYFNGLRGDTGYLFDPVTPEQLAAHIRGAGDSHVDRSWLSKILDKLKSPFQGLPMDVDSSDVAQVGWAIVFNKETTPEVREAVQPLIDHRRTQVPPDRCKVLEYQCGQGLQEWLKGFEAWPGSVIPTKVPYYILLIGDPAEIPFSFQCLLDIEYAVGRLSFNSAEQYHNYATSLVDYETKPISNSREVAYWGVRHDKATEMSADYLISPLYQDASPEAVAQLESYSSKCLFAEGATRSNLLNLFKDRPPAMLCTASHGLGWKMEDVDHQRQLRENGALCSQDWSGEGAPKMEDYVLGQDITDDLNVHGMVAFLFACYGVGTPAKNHFLRAGDQAEIITEKPFVSAFPQRLLGHPKGGALAVLGHVDMAWSYSFKPPKVGEQLQPFQNMIRRIISGEPIGHSTKDFSDRYTILSTELLSYYDRSQVEKNLSEKNLARKWTERNDAQNYVMLGDPAAKVRVDALADSDPTDGNAKRHDASAVRITQPQTHVLNVPKSTWKSQASSSSETSLTGQASAESETIPKTETVKAVEYSAPPQPAGQSEHAAGEGANASESMLFFLGTLRALRAQAQDLLLPLRLLQGIDRTADTANEQIATALASARSIRQQNADRIAELRRFVHQLSRSDAQICDWSSDEVTRIENRWNSIDREWPVSDEPSRQLQSVVGRLETELTEIIRLCGQLTIPGRVDQHLKSLWIGQAFDFHKAFEDELPDAKDRVKVLKFLADHPDAVSGVIDVESGVIFRASRSPRRRALSYIAIVVLALSGFGLLGILDWFGISLEMGKWSAGSQFGKLSGAYAFLLLGAIGHIVVSALKQSRQNASAGLIAVNDWLLWCHVRETSLMLTVIYLWIGLIGMMLVFTEPGALPTAFFVGYSIDSFVDLFLQKFSAYADRSVSSNEFSM